MNTNPPQDFSPKIIREQVLRFQEILYEFIKGLSKLRKDQSDFDQKVRELPSKQGSLFH